MFYIRLGSLVYDDEVGYKWKKNDLRSTENDKTGLVARELLTID
jgi:hypothetical protein